MERTEGSEPSQYLEEEKSNEIPSVAASERGRAQTVMSSDVRGCGARSYGVTNRLSSRRVRNGSPKKVTVL